MVAAIMFYTMYVTLLFFVPIYCVSISQKIDKKPSAQSFDIFSLSTFLFWRTDELKHVHNLISFCQLESLNAWQAYGGLFSLGKKQRGNLSAFKNNSI